MTVNYKIILILMIMSASANYLGLVSYLSLCILILINLYYGKFTSGRLFSIISFLSFYIINCFYTYSQNFIIDPVVVNVFLQLLFLLTFSYERKNILIVFDAVKFQILLSFVLGIIGLCGINNSMFIDAGSAKGFSGFFALTAIFATPQLLGSICVTYLVLNSSMRFIAPHKKDDSIINKIVSVCVLFMTLNRINILFFLSMKMTSSFTKKFGLVASFILFSIFAICVTTAILIFIPTEGVLLQTIQSRIALFEGVISTIDFNSSWQILLGMFNTIHFYLPEYIIDIYYVENGFLFIFKYFGVLGIMIYLILSLLLSVNLYRQGRTALAFFALYYLFIAQNFTNEFVSFAFPQIVSLLIFFSYNGMEKVFYSQKETSK